MIFLKNLLCEADVVLKSKEDNITVEDICFDSRKVAPGSVFVCIRGKSMDGHLFINEALEGGCAAVVAEELSPAVVQSLEQKKAAWYVVRDTRRALAQMAASFFGYPARELTLIGITGTKGKTTTSYMIREILTEAGIRCGLMGTIETWIDKEHFPVRNTTQESYDLHKNLRRMVDAGCKVCIMEVSSQGLMMQRVAGISFEIAVFTNISPDHIGVGEHKNFEEYRNWKSRLFLQCDTAVVNADDAQTDTMLKGSSCTRVTFSTKKQADYQASLVTHEGLCNSFLFQARVQQPFTINLGIPGDFQVYNALAAAAVAGELHIEKEAICRGIESARVKGRMECVCSEGDFVVILDYAHNAQSLSQALRALRAYEPERLVCLFGCGGNRSILRRYEMGEIAGHLADYSIVTSDNPRNEDPYAIIEDIRKGMGKTAGSYIEIPDRRNAIHYAVFFHRPGDLLLLAGKGHEMTQEIEGRFYPFDEREIVLDEIEKWENYKRTRQSL